MEYGENMMNADAMRMTGVCIFAVAVVQVKLRGNWLSLLPTHPMVLFLLHDM